MDESQTSDEGSPGERRFGRTLMFGTISLFLIYLLFSFVPEKYLIYLGLCIAPPKSIFVVTPIAICTVIFVFYTLIHPLINHSLTHPLDSINLIKDSNSLKQNAAAAPTHNGTPTGESTRIQPISDLDVEDVCKKLYYEK